MTDAKAIIEFVKLEELEKKAKDLDTLLAVVKTYILTHRGTSMWFQNSAYRYEYEVAAQNLYAILEEIEPNGNHS